jgi:hypothetical protein
MSVNRHPGQAPEIGTEPRALRCKHHPGTETYLRCGKCGEPICAKCVVITPVGARCCECAQLRRLPTFVLSPEYYARALAAMLGTAVVGGLLAGLLSRMIPFGAILIPLGLGYLVGEAVARATNRKRATPLKLIAGAGVVLAYAFSASGGLVLLLQSPGAYGVASVLPLVLSALLSLVANPFGLIFLALGVYVAISRI